MSIRAFVEARGENSMSRIKNPQDVGAAVLLIVGRVWPRVAVRREPDAESQRVRRTARLLGFVFAPLIRPVVWLTERLMRGGDGAEPRDDDHETGHMASNGHASSERDPEEGEIEQDEQEMITGVLHLERASAREIMVPRIDIVAVSREVLVSEAVDVAIQAGHSRIPVFGSG
jgi:CBS domain containing-hemolysin-like protein